MNGVQKDREREIEKIHAQVNFCTDELKQENRKNHVRNSGHLSEVKAVFHLQLERRDMSSTGSGKHPK